MDYHGDMQLNSYTIGLLAVLPYMIPLTHIVIVKLLVSIEGPKFKI